MINVILEPGGRLAICPSSENSPAKDWIRALFADPRFCSEQSDGLLMQAGFEESEDEKEWREMAVPDLKEACWWLRDKFELRDDGALCCQLDDLEHLAVFLNHARLKITKKGEGEWDIPSEDTGEGDQYTFLTALHGFILSQIRKLRTGEKIGQGED